MNKKNICVSIVLTMLILSWPLTTGLEDKTYENNNGFEDNIKVKIKGGFACKDFHKIILEIKNIGESSYNFPLILIDVTGINIFNGMIWGKTIIIDGTNDPIEIEPGKKDFDFDLENADIPKGFGIINCQVCFYLDLPGVQDAHCFIDGFHYNDLFLIKQEFHPLEAFNNANSEKAIFQK